MSLSYGCPNFYYFHPFAALELISRSHSYKDVRGFHPPCGRIGRCNGRRSSIPLSLMVGERGLLIRTFEWVKRAALFLINYPKFMVLFWPQTKAEEKYFSAYF